MCAKVPKNCPVIQRPVSYRNNPPQKTPCIPLVSLGSGGFLLGVDRITGELGLIQIGTDGRGRVVLYAGIANYVSSGMRPAVKGQDSDNAITDPVCSPGSEPIRRRL